MKLRDRLALVISIGLLASMLLLILIVAILAAFGKQVPGIFEHLLSGVFGAFVGYVGSAVSFYFKPV